MRVLSSDAFRKIDDYCINKLSIPELILMENAALKVIKNIDLSCDKFVIICGQGNNGGDGFAAARHLLALNKKIKVFFVGTIEKMSRSCSANYNMLKNLSVDIFFIKDYEEIKVLCNALLQWDVVIDALFGTGLSRNIEGVYKAVINTINEEAKYIISIDVPSGLNSDTGEIMGISIISNKTVTLEAYKLGFLNYMADKYTGTVVVENIGVPEFILEQFSEGRFISDSTMIRNSLIKRGKYANKGDFGRILLFAGSKGYSGAAYICTEAAVKSGGGLVTLCCPDEIMPIVNSKLTEAMTADRRDKGKIADLLNKCDAVGFGSGMGNSAETLELLQYVIMNAKVPVIIDADGINALSRNLKLLSEKKSSIIITPHLGEMSRITNLSIEYIKNNRIQVAEEFARENNIIVLLKGYNTVITDGKTTIINSTGSSAMASGGMGDCLTGIVAAFAAANKKTLAAVYCAAYVHGYAGDMLAQEMYSVNAEEVLKKLPYAIKAVEN